MSGDNGSYQVIRTEFAVAHVFSSFGVYCGCHIVAGVTVLDIHHLEPYEVAAGFTGGIDVRVFEEFFALWSEFLLGPV